MLLVSSATGVGCLVNTTKITKIYVLFLIIFHFANLVYYWKKCMLYENVVLEILFEFAFILQTFGCIIMTFCTNFFKNPNFYNIMDYVDSSLRVRAPKWMLAPWIVIIILLTISNTSGRLYELFNQPERFFGCYIGSSVQQIRLDIALCFVFIILTELCLRFKVLDDHLMNSFHQIKSDKNGVKESLQLEDYSKTIAKVSELHNMLCDELRKLNAIYGLNILFNVSMWIAFLVLFTNNMVYLYVIRKPSEYVWIYGTGFIECSVSIVMNTIFL